MNADVHWRSVPLEPCKGSYLEDFLGIGALSRTVERERKEKRRVLFHKLKQKNAKMNGFHHAYKIILMHVVC